MTQSDAWWEFATELEKLSKRAHDAYYLLADSDGESAVVEWAKYEVYANLGVVVNMIYNKVGDER